MPAPQPSRQSCTAPASSYAIGGQRFQADAPGFAQAIAQAHASRQRPLCLCLCKCLEDAQGRGIEMYVARLAGSAGGYIVKRMPDTGSQHATHCPSYEPPPEFSGLGQVLGSAITEDPATGQTTLKLDFPLTKFAGRSQMPPAGGDSDSVASDGTRLSLLGLLHYLWDQAELSRWHPGFAGKRNWAIVRKHLLLSAQNKIARGGALHARLYVPEIFSVEQRDAINARRHQQWSHWTQAAQAGQGAGKARPLMLLIGEVKEIVPARYGYKAVIKHVPDQAFTVDEQLYRRLGRRFEAELSLWGATDDVHMVMIATFAVNAAGVPTIEELSLMPVTQQWLPIEDGFEKQLVGRLVNNGRSFIKGLRYNMDTASALACATLTDCDGLAPLLFVDDVSLEGSRRPLPVGDSSAPVWLWNPSSETMPSLPPRQSQHAAAVESAVEFR